MNFQCNRQETTHHPVHGTDWMDDLLYDAIMGSPNTGVPVSTAVPVVQDSSVASYHEISQSKGSQTTSIKTPDMKSINVPPCGWLDYENEEDVSQESSHEDHGQNIQSSTFTVTIPVDPALKALVDAGVYVVQFRFVKSSNVQQQEENLSTAAQDDTRSEGKNVTTCSDDTSSHASTPNLSSCNSSRHDEEGSDANNSKSNTAETTSSSFIERFVPIKNPPLAQSRTSTLLVGPEDSSVPIEGINRGGYMDYSNVPEDKQSLPMSERNTGGVTRPFPERLYHMLTEDKYSDIVSWAPHGRAFHIKNPKTFEREVLEKYFNQTKYRSFQRQLNLYGFKRIHQDFDRGAYYHELFLRGRPNLCSRMKRQKLKGVKERKNVDSMELEISPNFYTMDSL